MVRVLRSSLRFDVSGFLPNGFICLVRKCAPDPEPSQVPSGADHGGPCRQGFVARHLRDSCGRWSFQERKPEGVADTSLPIVGVVFVGGLEN